LLLRFEYLERYTINFYYWYLQRYTISFYYWLYYFTFCRQIATLMPNQWLCFWVSTQLVKQHLSNICLKVVIQAR